MCLRGQPKSGTTWLEVMLVCLVQTSCIPSQHCIYAYESSPKQISVQLAAPGVQARSIKLEQWSIEMPLLKHTLPPTFRLHRADRTGDGRLKNVADLLLHRCVGAGLSIQSRQCLARIGGYSNTPPDQHTRCIQILRDPRAVVASGYHYYKGCTGCRGSWNESTWIRTLEREAAVITLRYVLTQTDSLRARTLNIFYEDLLEDTATWSSKMATFLGLTPTLQQVQAAIDMSNVSAMKKQEASGALPQPKSMSFRRGPKVRSGSATAFYADLSPEMLALFNQKLCRILVPELARKWLGHQCQNILLAPN